MEKETIQINLPDGWEQVTVGQFQEIISIHKDETKSDTVIGILTNEDDEVVRRMTLESRKMISELLTWTNTLPAENKYKVEITIDGVSYYLKDLNELLVDEWLELLNYCKNHQANMHKIFSCLYHCDGEQPRNKHELFENKVMIDDVYGTLVFFSLIASKSIQNMNSYIASLMMKMGISEPTLN